MDRLVGGGAKAKKLAAVGLHQPVAGEGSGCGGCNQVGRKLDILAGFNVGRHTYSSVAAKAGAVYENEGVTGSPGTGARVTHLPGLLKGVSGTNPGAIKDGDIPSKSSRVAA
jgi:hypothetical protein